MKFFSQCSLTAMSISIAALAGIATATDPNGGSCANADQYECGVLTGYNSGNAFAFWLLNCAPVRTAVPLSMEATVMVNHTNAPKRKIWYWCWGRIFGAFGTHQMLTFDSWGCAYRVRKMLNKTLWDWPTPFGRTYVHVDDVCFWVDPGPLLPLQQQTPTADTAPKQYECGVLAGYNSGYAFAFWCTSDNKIEVARLCTCPDCCTIINKGDVDYELFARTEEEDLSPGGTGAGEDFLGLLEYKRYCLMNMCGTLWDWSTVCQFGNGTSRY
ncbi:hypothetical protein K503DRAFT_859149 [Rhizopogon vinicolor AM-OR11-026]|uniref:Cyanovirin-N domain-containing protein n=1 Tax=Rhizopogon vinicolor AM-OR11-026 TaxID=1314800 RepID=A0A1B7MPM9_9AGAM|nr:hypothetical protein K503DRAFT_859149 [Rhizopogon vinicolor AM-OR11-026]